MKLRPFELALVIIFIVLALVSLALFASFDAPPEEPDGGAISGQVTIWGTVPGDGIQQMLAAYQEAYESYQDVSYRYIDPARFNDELVNALADQRGPDIVVFSHEQLVELRPRLFPESYESFPLADIRRLYVDGAEIFALSNGLQARPIAVDPLMLYWNRDILATYGYLEAPRTWEELVNVQFPDIIDRGFDRTINRSVVAMGEYGNVRNAFGTVSLLLIQGGSKGVIETPAEYIISLDDGVGGGAPLRSTASFYTRFGQPDNTLYSWNRSFSSDRDRFVSGDLAFYFGYASEGPTLERLNPNLNFDIAEVPQGAAASIRRTYGRYYGIGILRTTDNGAAAQAVVAEFSRTGVADTIAIDSGLVPTTRATVAAGSNSRYGRAAYQSAAIAYAWLNPDLAQTDAIFNTMMQDINENRRPLDAAVRDALGRLEVEY